MKTSIATVSISGNLREKLEAIAAAGFDGVEIFENDFLAYDQSPAEVRKMCADLGLEITLFQPFRDFEGLPEPHRSAAFERAERKFDLMGQLGAPLVLVCSSVAPAALGGIDRAAADFRELGERAAKRGLKVGFEALAWGRHVFDHRDAWEIVRRADHPNVGLILDSFHTLSRGINPDTIRSIPGDKIFFVQLADAPALSMDLLYWSRHYRNMPGEGDLPVVDFTRAVLATGYSGPLSLEIFNDQFRAGSPRTIAADGKRSLIFLADQARLAEPDAPIITPALPARAKVEGVSFVEFTANEAEAEQLAGLLGKLGFSQTGHHRSKAVNRYSQGDINIVINTEREGLAHAAYITHGTSAYAMGLLVEDAGRALDRARALDAQVFNQHVAPNELKIPAVRGIGGGVIYFLDRQSELADVWDKEFVSFPAQSAGARLTRVDHLAQTMNYEEMLTWILFYRSIFELDKSPMVDVVDPAGLIRSQVIESPKGELRLTLNGAENRKTLAGRFISETFGSSLQHIAFASSDIFETARILRENGLAALQISQNYYDDLAARFILSPELLSKLQAANLLYDRDANGEYFQLYTPRFGEGFFFEVVQRTGGYSGYGAFNAPFRIAAQRREINVLDGM
ncbi:sugar phosphate isomerase/epimerase and 4-hydroxyphenylpyruvate domain-containing protein [Devosia sp. MC521]|uniref:bifunctional sugar phosphate isomerase/epimerase/4-hydroxyphenylpyruvate dioxygenase family protein n=1 Tax=Devosia sp. MC521 TaxID=2759954 RepID=UPI0015F81E16|nr:sugar phosphate isomerase/epimerase and 4-hydroxyphenylpyruvate domain-containing protein [Devosia sp. MC521]MBJ6987419.1 sugar phosphate isomerase/epimerase and 4-hydroxyphenylpyruvate domain-containing protein [Devosia sp. MC521]QMW63586.1 sugar phosphate isomerase/epimerase and 4-hydroxyphenylpyruvate domain-containing protein [Devosia sp. MC521]